MAEALSTSVVLKEVVILYPHLFEKRAIPGSASEPQYNTGILLPPGFDLKPMQFALLAAAQGKFGSDAREQIKAGKIKLPFRKQAEKAAEGKAGYSDDPAALYINVGADMQPGVVDQRRQPVIDPDRIYGGLVVNIQVNAYAWQHPLSGKGLSFGLQNVQIVRDGPKLGNQNPDPSKVFDELEVPESVGSGGAMRTGAQTEADLKSLFE